MIVREGKVTKVVPRGAAPILRDGFVLTGHARAGRWLRDHLPVGASVRLRPEEPFREQRFERDVHKVDPGTGEFPAGRGANQLVVYTPAFGSRTGTNIFGSEAIVRRGRIVERTGGDSEIPKDGFVISGHGGGSAWNMRCCWVGSRVELKGRHLVVIRDREAYLLEAEAHIASATQRIDLAGERGFACPAAEARAALIEARRRLADARRLLTAQPREAEAAIAAARRAAWVACARASETRSVEARGAWLWTARVLAVARERRELLSRLASANMNMLLPLIGSILRLPNGEQVLHDLIDDAHTWDIEVHPWTWLPGHSIPRRKDAERITEHPDWADVSLKGKRLKSLDLTNPKVRAAIADDARWLVSNFDIDGIHLDWEGFKGGFSDIGRSAFEKSYGYDPRGSQGPAGPERIRDRYLWRVSLIDQMVADLAPVVRGARPGLVVSSAVQCFNFHPNISSDFGASHQWIRWCARGLIDVAAPMIYSHNVDFVSRTATVMDREIGKRSLHYAGLILYPETAQYGLIEPYQLLEQIDAVRAAGCEGIILFSAERLFMPPWAPDDRLLLTLKEGPFRKKAALPHRGWQRPTPDCSAIVPHLYAVAELKNAPSKIVAGQSADVTIQLKNYGTEPFDVKEVRVTSPMKWTASLTSGARASVPPASTVLVTATLRAPPMSAPGNARARLRVVVQAGAAEKPVSVSDIVLAIKKARP